MNPKPRQFSPCSSPLRTAHCSAIITGTICQKDSSTGIVFTRKLIFGFFAGRSRSSLPNFTLISSGVWVYGPKNFKKWNFTNIIAPKGRVPCTILTKFTGFMRVLSLHNVAAKFGCFSSINDKIIDNLYRRGVFSQIFDDP